MLSKNDIRNVLSEWYKAWNDHNLDNVIALFHDGIIFQSWTGAEIKGKKALRRAWSQWFNNHGGFRFTEKETFIDEEVQKALYSWNLEWPSSEIKHKGQYETRDGVDVLHFKDGKIIQKQTYSKTLINIGGKSVLLTASPPE